MKTIIILLAVLHTVGSFCQESSSLPSGKIRQTKGSMERSMQPGLDFPDYPGLILPDESRDIELPAVHDNSGQPYLRPVFSQQGASCGQAASVAYNFCYEINRLRNLPSDISVNQYPSHFVWNFMNATLPYYGEGVSYFHTFDILYDAGNPTEEIYGPITLDDQYRWMSGYESYFQAMHNRISGVNSIHAGSPEGLLILKHWLHNHLEGSPIGGVANYYAGMNNTLYLPAGTPEAGKNVQVSFGALATHALTIVGYNDSIRIDLNGDGLYTNHLDITGDEVADMRDWEIGGLKFINSYGEDWADSGFCYMLYRTLALKYGQGGIWNNSVHVVYPDTNYLPLLTAKATIEYNKRGRIKLTAGISQDTSRFYPDHTVSFSVFNNQGGDFFMQGNNRPDGKILELGLDITPLLQYTTPGLPSRIFLMIDETDPDNTGNGRLLDFSVISYLNPQLQEFPGDDAPISIVNNDKTITSAVINTEMLPVTISPSLVLVNSIDNQLISLEAEGGTEPYSWGLNYMYQTSESTQLFEPPTGEIQVPGNQHMGYATIPLPFPFPYFGEFYDTLYMHVNGYLMFEKQDMPYFYELFDEPYFSSIRAIAGYLNKDLSLNTAEDFLSVKVNQDQVTFNWRISGFNGADYVAFSIVLTAAGQISMHYGHASGFGFLPVIGLSNGSVMSTLLPKMNRRIVPEGTFLSFRPATLPGRVEMTDNGSLEFYPDGSKRAGEIEIIVMDNNRFLSKSRLLITTGPSIEITSDDPSALYIPGATIPLNIKISNHGPDSLSDLSFSLSPTSSNIQSNGYEMQGINLEPMQSVYLTGIYSMLIPDTITISQTASLEGKLNLNNQLIYQQAKFEISIPKIVVSPPVIEDGNNAQADPGEEVSLKFRIYNQANATAGIIDAEISVNDPFAVIANGSRQTLGELGGYSRKTLRYRLKTNDATPPGRIVHISLRLFHQGTLIFENVYDLPIGNPEVLVIDMDKNHNSAIHIAAALNDLQIRHDFLENIDSLVFNYRYIFISLGFFTQHYVLTPQEDSLLVDFLKLGRRIYLEGGAFFKQSPETILRTMLRVEGSSLAWPHPADTLLGNPDSPVDDFQIKYEGDWKRGENLLLLEPSISWFRDKNTEYNFVTALDSGYYKTIASSVEFGGFSLFNSPGKSELMKRYLTYLGYPFNPLSVVFNPDTNWVCKGSTVHYEPMVSGIPLTYHWTFEGGTPALWDGPFPDIKYESAGVFSASVTVNDGISNNSFDLNDLITVDNCAGVDEENSLDEKFRIFPNPACDYFKVETMQSENKIIEIRIIDLQGRVIQSCYPAGNNSGITIPVTKLSAGMYVVYVKGELWSGSSKLMINQVTFR